MDIAVMLDEFQQKALRDADLKNKILKTREEADPLGSFCALAREAGYEIYPMDVIVAGEEFYASMRRSTNGGGENAPKLDGEDDFYELFLAGIGEKEIFEKGANEL